MDTAEIRSILERECHLVPNRPLLVGVSGGPDSLCLLHLLHALGFSVIAAHFDHQLRPESSEDAVFVKKMASSLGAPSVIESGDVAAFARESKLSIEEAARTARYRFLFQQAQEWGAQAVAVGHTADDQVETLLMHLLRGAGISGLKGMSVCSLHPEWSSQIPLVRPLLYTWRGDTVAYCERLGLEPVYDASNQNQTFFRNRLRHELIPFLEGYNPQVKEVLLRTTRTLASDDEVLLRATREAWDACWIQNDPEKVAFSLTALRLYDRGLQRALVRRAIACLRPGLRDVDFDSIERALAFLRSPSQSRRMDLTAGLDLYTDGKRFWILERGVTPLDPDWPRLSPNQEVSLDAPGKVEIGSGWILEARVDPVASTDAQDIPRTIEADPYSAVLDASQATFPLIVRTRRPGDRFTPLGMDGHSMKVSDFFVNEQLPRPAREGWPLVWSNGRIAWIPGFRPSDLCRVHYTTNTVLRLIFYRS